LITECIKIVVGWQRVMLLGEIWHSADPRLGYMRLAQRELQKHGKGEN